MVQVHAAIDDIIDNFDLLDDWEDRYRYVIELGKSLQPLAEADRSEDNRVRGCASQVWVVSRLEQANGRAVVRLAGQSDALIVQGLVAITLTLLDGMSPQEILQTDTEAVFSRLGLGEHLTAQRTNGLRALVERIKSNARLAVVDQPRHLSPDRPDRVAGE